MTKSKKKGRTWGRRRATGALPAWQQIDEEAGQKAPGPTYIPSRTPEMEM